jgi:hypothetical protein
MSAIVDQLPSKDNNMISELFSNRMSTSSAPQSLPSHQSSNDNNKQFSILFQKVFQNKSSLF